jgi:hypothetical protein
MRLDIRYLLNFFQKKFYARIENMERETFGEDFLHQKDSTLHTSKEVESTVERMKSRDVEISQKPSGKIASYLTRFAEILEPPPLEAEPDFDRKERNIKFLKQRLYNKVFLKSSDIPQSYWNNKGEIMVSQGYGGDMISSGIGMHKYTDKQGEEKTNYIFPDSMKEEEFRVIKSNQKRSLDNWIDYLTSQDALYPNWAKYWAFDSVLKMGKFEKLEDSKARFQKRRKDTVSPFPLLNPAALSKTIEVLSSHLKEKTKSKNERQPIANVSTQMNDEDFQKLLSTEKFSSLYAQFLSEIPVYSTEGLENTAGEWKVYRQGSDPTELVKSLEGYPLEWCTAGYDIAETQLEQGDFHVYYSYDENGEAKIPRLAIRMQGSYEIAEPPRGIAHDQNLDPYISDVLREKMEEFGEEGNRYKKRMLNMEKLNKIYQKNSKGQELTKENLFFLYEIDEDIEGFGYEKDSRIEEIIENRKDILEDYNIIFAERKHYKRSINLGYLKNAKGLKLPESMDGDLDLRSLESAEGLELPKSIGGTLNLSSLESAEGLKLPESIRGSLDLQNLKNANGLKLPESIGGALSLSRLERAEGLKLPESIGGALSLSRLESAEGLKLPESIGGDLFLSSLESAEGLELPRSIGGTLSLGRLESAEGLELPKSIGRNLYLSRLERAEGLKLPESIGGTLFLSSLQRAEGLELPKSIGRNLYLNRLESAEGLELPESIGGDLFLSSLQSAEGLKLPESIGRRVILYNIDEKEVEILKRKYPSLDISTS